MTKGIDMNYICQAPNSVSNNSSLCTRKLFSSLTPIIKSLNHDVTVFKPPLKVYLFTYIFCAIPELMSNENSKFFHMQEKNCQFPVTP
jgi:hypothetical protein